jgi:hypothetical protein
MDFVSFKQQISGMNDTELLELLELVSNEVKHRNSLMVIGDVAPDEAVQKITDALFLNLVSQPSTKY